MDNVALENLYVTGTLDVDGTVTLSGALNITEGAIADSTIISADIKNDTVGKIDIAGGFIQAWVHDIDNLRGPVGGIEVTISFDPAFEVTPVVIISDNDFHLVEEVKDVTTSDFTVHLEDDGAFDYYTSGETIYAKIHWIAILPK